MDVSRTTPMMEQYRRIKKQHEGSILFFRLGDFYEMFSQDAVEVSALINLTLTSRNGLPMCGIPYHAAKSYIARLLKLGKKIAICEQLTQPGKGTKIVDRDVVEIITPGTTVDDDFLDKGSSNYLGCLTSVKDVLSFSYIDLSTGDFFTTVFAKEGEILAQELERLQLKELLIQESLLEENNYIASCIYNRPSLVLNRLADWIFDPAQAKARLEKQFGFVNLKSFGLNENSAHIVSAGALLDYLDTTSKSRLVHIRTLNVYKDSEYLGLDEATQRNLELTCNQRDADVRFSLLEVMDETRCSMGRRLLKRRLLHPLMSIDKINRRLDITEYLYRDQGRLSKLRELLGRTPDLERLCSRLAMDKAHGRDMLAIKNAVASFIEINSVLAAANQHESGDLAANQHEQFEHENADFDCLISVRELLEKSICDEPSIVINEGDLIKDRYNKELDALKAVKDNSRQILENYLEEEKQATGITSLKIRYNRLIGYFFEVTKTHLSRVPSHFIKRQGIIGGERYTTDRLASLESDINGAADKIVELEKKLFLEIRDKVKLNLPELTAAARRLAEIDTAQSLAKAASVRNWTRPLLDDSGVLEITGGRHPVVEAHSSRGEYIPNDIFLGVNELGDREKGIGVRGQDASFVMITGPNMAGKSTYLRSAALITIMAQMGSFVPADHARIGLCDRIYCRVGASDNLARGESTFLVEMNETAFILNTATEKSLVIMDEVGRGTATNDGLSIAWAVSEELLNRVKCRTLFATHFHELSLLTHPRLANRSMEVLEQGEKIVFLRRIKDGPAGESYGIHVAMLAGLSRNVLQRAAEIMALLKERDVDLELSSLSDPTEAVLSVNQEKIKVNQSKDSVSRDNSQSGSPVSTCGSSHFLKDLLNEIDPDKMTPVEALNLLCQWKKLLEAEAGCNESLQDAHKRTVRKTEQLKKDEASIDSRSRDRGEDSKKKVYSEPSLFD